MLTVKDFAQCLCKPESVLVMIGDTRVDLVNADEGELDEILTEALGDYVVSTIKANKPDEYCVWVAQRPIRINDV